ncbi:MAG: sigma-70 family RNA polymerase sigma factor [Nocardioides sp.]
MQGQELTEQTRRGAGPSGPTPNEQDELIAALGRLRGYAMALTRDPDDADDLLQIVAVKVLETSSNFAGRSSLDTWLHRIAYHAFIDSTRRRTVDPVDDEILVQAVEDAWHEDTYTVDAALVCERAERNEELYDALVRLPVIYRSAVLLHDMEGLTAREVAEICSIGLPAAKQRIRRGRALLVTALDGGPDRRAALQGVPMKCWEARRQIDDYLGEELASEQRRLLENHLASCPTCPALYAGIVGVRVALGNLRDPDSVVPPALADRIAESNSTAESSALPADS